MVSLLRIIDRSNLQMRLWSPATAPSVPQHSRWRLPPATPLRNPPRPRRRGRHLPPRCPLRTGEPWWHASRPCTLSAGTTQTGLCRGTTAHWRNQSYFAMLPSSLSARHPGNVLAAPRSNAEPKAPSRTGSASTTGRMHPRRTAAGGSPARAGGPSLEGAGPGPASIQLPLQPPPEGRGGGGSGRRPA